MQSTEYSSPLQQHMTVSYEEYRVQLATTATHGSTLCRVKSTAHHSNTWQHAMQSTEYSSPLQEDMAARYAEYRVQLTTTSTHGSTLCRVQSTAHHHSNTWQHAMQSTEYSSLLQQHMAACYAEYSSPLQQHMPARYAEYRVQLTSTATHVSTPCRVQATKLRIQHQHSHGLEGNNP